VSGAARAAKEKGEARDSPALLRKPAIFRLPPTPAALAWPIAPASPLALPTLAAS